MKQTILKRAALFLSLIVLGFNLSAQNVNISGKVVDNNGEPVIGASVVLVGNTTVGAITDMDGNYRLSVPANSSVTVSFIGYQSQTVAVSGRSVINFTLQEDNEFLEETVVIGYGVQRKSDLTGSVASVKEADLSFRSTSDAAAALQGKAAGIQVSNASGAPGKGSDIRVRGVSSNGQYGLGPLLIVDGLKVDNIQYLDPSMIESIEVLKDAASAAIYGAQAGNGVILVTTKSGAKATDGNVFFQYQVDLNRLGHRAKVMNAEQYIDWMTQAGYVTSKEALIAEGKWDGKTDTNWADAVYGLGINHRVTVGAQSGSDKGSYYVALTYVDQNGMVKGDKDFYKRLTAQINADYKIKPWFTIGTNTSIERYQSQAVSEHSEYSNGANGTSLLGTLIIDPLTPVFYTSYDQLPNGMKSAIERGMQVEKNEDGYYYATSKMEEGDGGNPLVFRDRNNNLSEGFNVRGTLYANITPFKGLVFTSRFGYRIAQGYSHNYVDPYYLNSKLYYETYELSANSSQNYYYQWENFANYNINLGKHAIGAMAGMSYTYNASMGVNGSLTGSEILTNYAPNYRYFSYVHANAIKSVSGTPNESTQISYFGRLTYSYDNRYSAQVNFRADAFDSSKLSKKSRWGYFPSVSVGWTVSNEPWFDGVKDAMALDFLKFRASWGVNGNIAVARDYKYATSISKNSTNYQFDPDANTLTYGSRPSGVANPDLKWETSIQKDFGMDARFLGNRLTLGVDYFIKDTDGLLVNITPIAEAGITSSTVNAGSIRNQGLEVEAGWQDTIGDFRYSINGNFSTLKNMVTYLEPSVGRQTGADFAGYYTRPTFEEGHSTWYLRSFEYAGVDRETGTPLFINGEGKTVTSGELNSSVDLKDVGPTIPTLTYGVTINLAWRSFDLIVFGSGAAGNVMMPCVYRLQHPRTNSLVYFYENSWTPNNKDAKLPSISSIQQDINYWSSTANIFKGDYFKIKQIQLGYTLPKTYSKKVGVDNLRVYTSLDDYFLFTKYPGFDPETASTGAYNGGGIDKGSYPNAKRLIFGINVSF